MVVEGGCLVKKPLRIQEEPCLVHRLQGASSMVDSPSTWQKEPGEPGEWLDELTFVLTAKLIVELCPVKCGGFVCDCEKRLRRTVSVVGVATIM